MPYDIQHLASAIAKSLPYPLFIMDDEGKYIDVVGGNDRTLYDSTSYLVNRNLFDVLPRELAEKFIKTIRLAIDTCSLQIVEYKLDSSECNLNPQDGPQGTQWFQGRIFPIDMDSIDPSSSGRKLVVWAVNNITRQRSGNKEPAAEVPEKIVQICVYCKNVRSDEEMGSGWERLETYLETHTHLSFSHGMCPECVKQRYSRLYSEHLKSMEGDEEV